VTNHRAVPGIVVNYITTNRGIKREALACTFLNDSKG